jgi:hypothetical protein
MKLVCITYNSTQVKLTPQTTIPKGASYLSTCFGGFSYARNVNIHPTIGAKNQNRGWQIGKWQNAV